MFDISERGLRSFQTSGVVVKRWQIGSLETAKGHKCSKGRYVVGKDSVALEGLCRWSWRVVGGSNGVVVGAKVVVSGVNGSLAVLIGRGWCRRVVNGAKRTLT